MATWLQQVQGKAGKALSTLGSFGGSQGVSSVLRQTGNILQSAGGQIVRPASASTQSYSQPQSQLNGSVVNAGGSVYGGSNYNIPSQTTPSNNNTNNGSGNYGQVNQGLANGNSQIDSDYEQSMGMLASAESGLQGQAATANQTIDTQFGAVKNEVQNTQTTAESGANASLSTSEKQGTSAMQQARDLFRQTQQSNTAQLSALGISSSSVAEALAERLGVETARRIAGVTGSVQEVRQNTVNELGRIKTYYQGKIQEATNQVAIEKSNIQNSLMQGLNQINSARSQAASDKANARANLLSQVQNQIYALTAQEQQFQQELKAWAEQKSAALTPITQDPNYLNTLISTAQNFNQKFAPSGFAFTPEVSVDKNGVYTGKITSNKKTDDDPLAELYRQAGLAQ